MKKTILLAAFAAAIISAANAQQSSYRYVAPITMESKQFNVQTLRDSAVSETEYIAELNALLKTLNNEKDEIANANKGLKLEKDLYKVMTSSYKTRKSQLGTEKKNCEKEIKTYESLLKDLQKQQDIIRKMNVTDGTSVKDHSARLEEQGNQYKGEKKHLEELFDELNKNGEKEIQNMFTMLNDYLIEITDKEMRLKNLAAQNKTNIEIVKSAIKAANGK